MIKSDHRRKISGYRWRPLKVYIEAEVDKTNMTQVLHERTLRYTENRANYARNGVLHSDEDIVLSDHPRDLLMDMRMADLSDFVKLLRRTPARKRTQSLSAIPAMSSSELPISRARRSISETSGLNPLNLGHENVNPLATSAPVAIFLSVFIVGGVFVIAVLGFVHFWQKRRKSAAFQSSLNSPIGIERL